MDKGQFVNQRRRVCGGADLIRPVGGREPTQRGAEPQSRKGGRVRRQEQLAKHASATGGAERGEHRPPENFASDEAG